MLRCVLSFPIRTMKRILLSSTALLLSFLIVAPNAAEASSAKYRPYRSKDFAEAGHRRFFNVNDAAARSNSRDARYTDRPSARLIKDEAQQDLDERRKFLGTGRRVRTTRRPQVIKPLKKVTGKETRIRYQRATNNRSEFFGGRPSLRAVRQNAFHRTEGRRIRREKEVMERKAKTEAEDSVDSGPVEEADTTE